MDVEISCGFPKGFEEIRKEVHSVCYDKSIAEKVKKNHCRHNDTKFHSFADSGLPIGL